VNTQVNSRKNSNIIVKMRTEQSEDLNTSNSFDKNSQHTKNPPFNYENKSLQQEDSLTIMDSKPNQPRQKFVTRKQPGQGKKRIPRSMRGKGISQRFTINLQNE